MHGAARVTERLIIQRVQIRCNNADISLHGLEPHIPPRVQVFQVADRLADAGFVVAVFDPFDGKPWPMSEFPPPDGAKFMAWINSMPIEVVAATAGKVRQWMVDNRGATSFGVTGYCWGSSVSFFLAGAHRFAEHALAFAIATRWSLTSPDRSLS